MPSASLIIEDCEKIEGAKVVTYDADKIAASPAEFKPLFTELLTPAQVCVTLVRQQRGDFQNVSFMAECIKAAGLKTFLIAKTGTPDPSYLLYDTTMYSLSGVVGMAFVANALVRPVDPKYFTGGGGGAK